MLVNISSIYYPLEKTGNSSTLVAAFQRYLHTITHVLSWYETDIFDTSSEGTWSMAVAKYGKYDGIPLS